jgi:arylsulfatase A-like enzyme
VTRNSLCAACIGLALAVLALGCEEELRRPEMKSVPVPRATRGYILISIDTLRADHLGCYGYPRPTSPFLDSLARRATLFEEAYSQFPSTLVSHMSMLTGLYPREHGVFPPNSVLSPKVETMPEAFQRNGFRTAGFTEGGYVSGRYGFRRGFDEFDSRDRGAAGERLVEKTFRRGTTFLKGLGPNDRFFLFLHTYAVHAPYDAPQHYQDLFWNGPPPAGAIPPTGPALTRWNMTGERPPQPVIDRLQALYDAGIRQTDDVLRGFFGDLERLGLAGDVTVVITADHGEEFQEHGRFNHTQLYRETLHVPLLVIHPDASAPVRQAGIAQLIDLAPTFYELSGVKPKRRPSGVSLAPRIGRPSPAPSSSTAWGETMGGERSVYRGDHGKLESLLLFDPPLEDWLPRRVAFDSRGGSLAFQARSFLEPHRLIVRRGEEVLQQLTLVPDWGPVQVSSPGPGRLILEADGSSSTTSRGIPARSATSPGSRRGTPARCCGTCWRSSPARWPRPRHSRSIPVSKRACGRSATSSRSPPSQEQDRVTWVLWPHWCGQSSSTHLHGQRTTKISFVQQRTKAPALQHWPIGVAEQIMLEPQPAMLEHWKVAGQA